RAPGDPGVIEHGDEVARGALVVARGVVVVEDPEVGPGLEPQVVGQARVVVGRVVVLLRVRGPRQQRAVDVRGRRAALDGRPVGVLHHDEEHCADGGRRRSRGGGGRPGGGRGRGWRPGGGRVGGGRAGA